MANELKKALNNLSNPRVHADIKAKAQQTLDNIDGPMATAAISEVLYPRSAVMRKDSQIELKLLFLPTLER